MEKNPSPTKKNITHISVSWKKAENQDGYIFTFCIFAVSFQKVVRIRILEKLFQKIGLLSGCVVFGRMASVLLLLFVSVLWIAMHGWAGVGQLIESLESLLP